uniref:Nucleolar protein 4 n=1 Tax=Sus scrofa TaxID=9823 RepID=A0A4X1VHA2_PIG
MWKQGQMENKFGNMLDKRELTKQYRKMCEMLKVSNTDFRELCLPSKRSGDTISNELLRVPEKNAFKPRWNRS